MEEKLFELLTEEEGKLSKLVEILKEKRRDIERNDATQLEETLRKEEKTVKELDSLEKERNGIVGKLAAVYQCEAVLSELLTHLREPMRHKLSLTAARLTELLNEVSLLNLGIQQMIAYRLEEFDFLMNAVRGKKVTYDDYENDQGGTIFNRRA